MEKNKARKMMPQCPAMAGCPAPQFIQQQCMPQCIPQEEVIENVRLAAAYVPWQNMCKIFSPVEALKRGTVFPELYSPYDGRDKMCCDDEAFLRRSCDEG